MSTKFVYFDLGNVILKFSHDLACQQLADRGNADFEDIQRVLFGEGLENHLETGTIANAEFCRVLREQAGVSGTDEMILEATSDIFATNVPVFPIIGQLTAVGFPLGILSNTCAAHWDWVCQQYPVLTECFPTCVLSYEVQSMKPDAAIYQQAIRSAQDQIPCEPNEIFFVDDREENVAGAVAAGLDAVQFESARQLRSDLEQRGVRCNL